MKQERYVLVTPARNEEAYIKGAIEAVASQTVLPLRWVIVSDGSVDRTDEIVLSYARRYSFIKLLRVEQSARRVQRDFGAKVRAFRAGYEQLNDICYQFVGNLDADITLGPQYFEENLKRFQANPRLGLAGGLVHEPSERGFAPQRSRKNSVCGSVQLFRKECYEAFGGYIPMQMGGVDAAAEIMARQHGWLVETFPDIPVYAQRKVITGGASSLHTRYRQGMSNYLLGYHPLFQLASCVSRMDRKPYVIGSLATLLGYGSLLLRRRERSLSRETIRFLRAEQMHALVSSLTLGALSSHSTPVGCKSASV